MFSFRGDPDRLLGIYEDHLVPMAVGVTGQRPPLSHACVRTDDGMMIVDVWESEEALQAFIDDPRFRAVIDSTEFPEPQVRILRVHRFGLPAPHDDGAGASRSS
jgi:hypothetical protein